MERRSLALLLVFSLQVIWAQEREEPYLKILPERLQANLGQNVYFECKAHLPNKDLMTEMRWIGPNGEEILPEHGNRIRTLEPRNAFSLELLINNFKREDTGLYRCTGVYTSNQKLEAEVKVEFHMDITFLDVQPKQTPIIYTDAKIKCNVESDPPPEVDWLKDGTAIRQNDPRLISKPDGILIKNITEADEGVYRCRARVAKLGQIEFKDIQVEVLIPPVITGKPEDIAGKEEDAVTFQCIATGKPAPSYSWVDKDNQVLKDKEGYFVDDVTGELHIMHLKPEHTGMYRCTAKNFADEVTAEAYLTVLTKPKIEQYLNLTIGEEDDAEMRCVISGDPLPEAIFKKESEPTPFVTGTNDDSRIQVLQTEDEHKQRVGILKITGVTRKDDGLYTCKGKSDGGENEAWGHITVEFAPTFEDQIQKEFWSWEQKPVNISCLATSIPNATIQWFLRNEPIRESDPNFRVMSLGPNGILNVRPLDGSYFDKYTCRASNSQGTLDQDVELKQVERPGPVSSAQVKKSTATTVSWVIREPINNGGLPIKGYDVQYKFEDSSWDNSLIKYWPKDSAYIVDELEPLRMYIFRFAAKNDAGVGAWSGEKSVDMPKRNAPEEPLIFGVEENKVKYLPYTTHYELQWEVPLSNGEPIDHFQIVYFLVKNSTKGSWDSVSKATNTEEVSYPEGGTTFKIEGLKSDSYYKIELRAHNEIGYSQPAETIIKTRFDETSQTVKGSGGDSGGYSSTATPSGHLRPASSNATEPIPSSPSDDDLNIGLLVGCVIVGLIILLVILDVMCYFAKNMGVIASCVNKLTPGDKEKDKEAMLQETNINASNDSEGKEKEANNRDESVPKEVPPSETTPMITGEDKEAILKEEKEILKEEEELSQKKKPQEPLDDVKKSQSKTSLSKDSPV